MAVEEAVIVLGIDDVAVQDVDDDRRLGNKEMTLINKYTKRIYGMIVYQTAIQN